MACAVLSDARAFLPFRHISCSLGSSFPLQLKKGKSKLPCKV